VLIRRPIRFIRMGGYWEVRAEKRFVGVREARDVGGRHCAGLSLWCSGRSVWLVLLLIYLVLMLYPRAEEE
jgi:hypothetical protein